MKEGDGQVMNRDPNNLSRRRVLALWAAASAGGYFGLGPRHAGAVQVEIPRGAVQPMPIALPDFTGGAGPDGDLARTITQIIAGNLRRSGLFAPIDPAAYIEKVVAIDALPRFPDWRAISAQALVTGRLTRQPDGRLKAEFRLWDVSAGQQLVGQQYFTLSDN